MIGNYNLYFSITKEDFKKPLPSELQGRYSRVVDDVIEVASSWEEAADWGMFPWVRKSLNWDTPGAPNVNKYAVVKDDWSHLTGEVSAMIAMGSNKAYPKNSILTKAEAQTLVRSDIFAENMGEN